MDTASDVMSSLLRNPLTFWTGPYALASVATVGVLLYAAKRALEQIEETRQTRHAALMADLSKRWDEPLMTESRRLAASYPPDRLRKRIAFLETQDDEELYALERIPNFLEDLAVLEEAGAIPFDMLRKSLGGTLVRTWDHWRPTVVEMRGDQKYDLVYEHFERLAERMRKELLALGELPGAD